LHTAQRTFIVDQAVRLIELNYYQELTLENVARQIYLSPCYFSRLFSEIKGLNFSKYLTQVRIEKSKKLLINTNLNIKQVCKQIGYRDSRYFSMVFKQYVGITPTGYRRQFLNNVINANFTYVKSHQIIDI